MTELKPTLLPDSPETRGLRIKQVRLNLLGKSREELCTGSTIGLGTLKGWEIGVGGGVSNVGAQKLVNHLSTLGVHTTTNWILHGLGPQPTTGMLLQQTPEEIQIIEELLIFRKQPGSIDALITDDTMIPLFYPGNYVGGILTNNLKCCIDKACIIITADNEKLVRILENDSPSDLYTLRCQNTHTELVQPIQTDISIIAAAPIIFIRRKNPDR